MNNETFIKEARFERQSVVDWSAKNLKDRYKICESVGHGKYGKVFKAIDIQSNRLVALKLINIEQEKHGFPMTALREIKLLRTLKHPNIVSFIEVVVNESQQKVDTYFVLEYLEHDFESLMRTLKFDERQLKCVMSQFLQGLAFMHKNNVYHRDLKPNNILYSNTGRVKICDFGMANKVRFPQTTRIQIAQYRAPEIFLGQRYSTKVDIWSAGMFLLELTLGRERGLFTKVTTEFQCFQQMIEKCGTPTEDNYPGVTKLPHYYEFIKKNYDRSLRQYIIQCSSYSLAPELLDLIDCMLTVNPEQRISAEQALNHSYFTSFPPQAEIDEMPKLELECNSQTMQNKAKKSSKQKNSKTGINNNKRSGTQIQVPMVGRIFPGPQLNPQFQQYPNKSRQYQQNTFQNTQAIRLQTHFQPIPQPQLNDTQRKSIYGNNQVYQDVKKQKFEQFINTSCQQQPVYVCQQICITNTPSQINQINFYENYPKKS